MEVADEHRAPLTIIEEALTGYGIALPGTHQHWNAALALEALHQLGISLQVDAVRAGLADTRWPGRFDHRKSRRIVLDAAHNADGARALVATWNAHFPTPPSALIFGALREKNAESMLRELATLGAPLHLCPVDSPRAHPLEELAETARQVGIPENNIHQHPDLATALQTAATLPGTALLTGSLYLVGESLAHLENTPRLDTAQ
jgi:dihydrofolate synthase/folylpolyglutamate synthase